MQLKSLVLHSDTLVPVQLEISFLPGLPQIHFLGLPDQIIKESLFRIKSAFRACSFEFPKTHQIVVNIRPTHFKKSSRGLELAVALGILQATGQIQLPDGFEEWVIYGELSLSGEVEAPDDLFLKSDWRSGTETVLSGEASLNDVSFPYLILKKLDQIGEISEVIDVGQGSEFKRPSFGSNFLVSKEQARFLEIMAWGGHSALLAGPAGSGKSTLAKILHGLLPPPTQSEWQEIKNLKSGIKEDLEGPWRPFIQPHHTSTALSMVGGGVPPRKGEVSRAHRGLLVLDEFLEFNPRVQESLREPMEDGKIRISRSNMSKEFPAKAQYIGTTNLCPCGDWVPTTKVRCSRSASKCRSYREKLSGPVLDRFQILFFCQRNLETGSGVSVGDVQKRLALRSEERELGEFAFLPESEILRRLNKNVRLELYPWEQGSYRRKLAALRVALTIAELAGRSVILPDDIEESFRWTWLPHLALKNEDQLTWVQNQTNLGTFIR